MADTNLKRCARCRCEKERTAFYRDRARKDGLRSYCKACDLVQIRNYQANHVEEIKAARREYLARPDVAVAVTVHRRVRNARRRARVLSAPGSYTIADVQNLKTLQRSKCAICRVKLKRYHVDHIQPLSNGGTNESTNLQLLCPSCNCSKHAKDPLFFMQQRGFLL